MLRACLPRSYTLERGVRRTHIETYQQALAVYFDNAGDGAINQPGRGDSGYDHERGGWLFANINGPLALVQDDGTVVAAVYDHDEAEWVIPD